jgi:hypothetical protein
MGRDEVQQQLDRAVEGRRGDDVAHRRRLPKRPGAGCRRGAVRDLVR